MLKLSNRVSFRAIQLSKLTTASTSMAKKMTIRSLSEEFEIFKKVMLEEVTSLKQTVKELQEEVKELKGNDSKKARSNELECKKCDDTFKSYKNLKNHILEIHPHKIKCVSCEKTFQKNFEPEMHIKTSHKETEGYSCDKCDQNCSAWSK